MPACFGPAQTRRVVDPTGGGNGFLGGLAVGLARGQEVVEACAWGSVAASFCIEQVGVPVLTSPMDDKGVELWNGESVMERLATYEAKLNGKGRLVEDLSKGLDQMDIA